MVIFYGRQKSMTSYLREIFEIMRYYTSSMKKRRLHTINSFAFGDHPYLFVSFHCAGTFIDAHDFQIATFFRL